MSLLIPKPKQEEQTVVDEDKQQHMIRRREGEVVVGPHEDVVFATPPTSVVLGCAALDDSRRLFQRLWTDEDEIKLLQGFLDHQHNSSSSSNNNNNNNNNNGHNSSSSYHHDTALFYEQIKDSFQLGFNKNQLVEKLRRLKKKYRTAVARISSSSSGKDFFFKTPHDQASFEISRKIWGSEDAIAIAPAPAPASDQDDDLKKPDLGDPKLVHFSDRDEDHKCPDHGNSMNHKGASSSPSPSSSSRKRSRSRSRALLPCNNGGIEGAVMSCVSPLLKELMMGCATSSSGDWGIWGLFNFNFNPPLLLSGGGGGGGGGGGRDVVVEEKWRKQRVLELETYSKRVELVQEQVKLALEELRSINPSL